MRQSRNLAAPWRPPILGDWRSVQRRERLVRRPACRWRKRTATVSGNRDVDGRSCGQAERNARNCVSMLGILVSRFRIVATIMVRYFDQIVGMMMRIVRMSEARIIVRMDLDDRHTCAHNGH